MSSNLRRCRALSLALVLGLIGTACSDDGDSGESRNTAPSEGGSWTVLHYSMADTDLEPFMIADVAEMGEVGSGENLDIVALVDRHAEYSTDPVLGIDDWVGAKLLHVGQGEAEVLDETPNLNLGDPATLTQFIADGVKNFPADNYSLIISDHGGPWQGIGPDEGGGGEDALTLPELTGALTAGLEGGGIEKFGLLGFDACLMATYETASAMAPFAERMVASQELEPGHGWDYRSLQTVHDRGGATPDELGTVLVESYADHAEENGTEADITLSMVDLTQMAAVDEALAGFSTALAERGQAVAPVVGRELATNLAFGKSPDPVQNMFSTDLGLLASGIGEDAPDVAEQAEAVVQAVDAAVLASVAGPSTTAASGLAIYFPTELQYVSPEYGSVIAPTPAAPWNAFLASYYGAGAAIPAEQIPAPATPDGEAEVFFDEDGLNILGNFNAASLENLSEAVIDYGIIEDDGSVTYIGQEPAEIAEDGSGQVLGIYDLTVLEMSDGEDTTHAYLALTIEEGDEVATIDVPMAYYAEGDQEGETYQDVLLTLTFEIESGDILNETYYAYNEASETYGELTADPEGIIVPEVLNIAEDGTETWVPTTDVGLYADLPNIEYDFVELESGTPLQAEVTVWDFGGNSASVGAQVEVP